MNMMSLPTQPDLPRIAGPRAPHDPRREMMIGASVVGLFIASFLGWSVLARFDAAVIGNGVVQVAGRSQTVQSAGPGVVSALRVKDGQSVKAGQVLIELATTEARAQERALASRVFGLQAEIARINAERSGAPHVAEPAEWATLSSTDHDEARLALTSEQHNLDAVHSLLSAQQSVLKERVAQTSEQIGGYRERQASNNRQDELNRLELNATQQLYEKGYATRTRVLALQRTQASIHGEMGATTAEMARLGSVAGETRMQMLQLREERQRTVADRLAAAQTELQSALPQWQAAREQLSRTQVRAPVTGTVMGLSANTVGGVVAAGQKLMQIVPKNGSLVVEAQVALSDANDLRVGYGAKVRVTGMRGRYLAPLDGKVTRVSAESVADEKTGHSFYTATIDVPRTEMDRLSHEAGISGTLRPGTPVSIAVPLRTRSVLGYWFEPLTERFANAFSGG